MELNEDERVAVKRNIHRSAVLQKVFSGPDGKEALEIIDEITGYKSNTFRPDPYKHAYNAGCKASAIVIHNALDGDVEKAIKMLGEQE